MICVTGAGGTVGGQVVEALMDAGAQFRAAYHSGSKAEVARAKGIEAVLMDYSQPDALAAALAGCGRLFLLGPNLPAQTQLELNVVQAAQKAGVQHVVKQSVYGADGEDFSLALVHRPVEKAIEASNMSWTFLRPNSFMQNVLTFMAGTIKAESAIYSASGDGQVSHVDVRDIAAVAARALTAGGHEGKAYTLTGPRALSYAEMAAELSQFLGRTIQHISLPPKDLRQAMLAEGMPGPLAERMLDLERYFHQGRASRITGDIKAVTGNEPRSFEQYAKEAAPFLQPE
jgi:uncharacterized protein YbjT (DUF2867 family)